MFTVDLRLDQAPGVWINAAGTVPLGLFQRDLPGAPHRPRRHVEPDRPRPARGLTDVVRNVSGQMQLDVKAVGTSRDPHFQGAVDVTDAGFLVTATGSRYTHGRAALKLASDRVAIDSLHLEDSGGHPLDVHGSLGTHELTVGDLQVDGTARHFEVVHNEFGHVDVDATLQLRGKFESPRVGGEITINTGDLKVDEILDRLLFRPYSTEQVALTPADVVDAVKALNPWDRLTLDITLHVPNNLKLTGENVQVSPGTPIGLGNINLRVGGDLSLYKDPGQPLSVTGSLDSMSGTYTFPGTPLRRRRSELHQLPRRSESGVVRHRYARHLQRRDARGHHGPADQPRAAAVEHAAARCVRHSLADRVQHLDEPSSPVRSRPSSRFVPPRSPPAFWRRRSSRRCSGRSASTRSRSSRPATTAPGPN